MPNPPSISRLISRLVIVLSLALLSPFFSLAQLNEWTWMGGDTASMRLSHLGASSINMSQRERHVIWVDSSDNVWMFGGIGTETVTAGFGGSMNDLWKYDAVSNTFEQIHSTQSTNYGTMGVASPSNHPGRRYDAVSWIDTAGSFWLFGGYGFSNSSGQGHLNDLWRFDPQQELWTWMGGSDSANQIGNYGTLLIPSTTNEPGARQGALSWADSAGNFWLFGGGGYSAAGNTPRLHDLWNYNVSAGEWTWMHGEDSTGNVGTYGTLGVSAPTNLPGARFHAAGSADEFGNFYMFGGNGFSSSSGYTFLRDLWKYDIVLNQWVWMDGPMNTTLENGNFGTQGVPSTSNYPGERFRHVVWLDSSDMVWVFGGDGYAAFNSSTDVVNDLWRFNPSTSEWTWVAGSNTSEQAATLGVQGFFSPLNAPGARRSMVAWQNSEGKMFMHGGGGLPITPFQLGGTNDVWTFDIASGQWAWLVGSQHLNPGAISAPPMPAGQGPAPGATRSASIWQSSPTSIHMYGGYGAHASDDQESKSSHWKFSTASNSWEVVRYRNPPNEDGKYVDQGSASEEAFPGARSFSATWTDHDGDHWFFSGGGSWELNSGNLNDLWKYDPDDDLWTWVGGSGQPANYGTQGISGPQNWPQGRIGAATWVDTAGNLWLFGGLGRDTSLVSGERNDLWKYEINSGEWTWMGGSQFIDQTGTYGTLGQPSANNIPGARVTAHAWTDTAGVFWLFGGSGFNTASNSRLSDMWTYNPNTNEWTWISGDDLGSSFSSYGSLGVASPSNAPGGRNNGAYTQDQEGNFWLFGGSGWSVQSNGSGRLNDLWKFEPATGLWTWVNGIVQTNLFGVYGTPGISSSNNYPGGRLESRAWMDENGNFWLFGGNGFHTSGFSNSTLNDLWKFTVDTCSQPSAPLSTNAPVSLMICNGDSVTLTATGAGTLRWYLSAIGGSPIDTGNTFVTPALDYSQTFYVEDFTCGSSPRTAVEIEVTPEVYLQVNKPSCDGVSNGTVAALSPSLDGSLSYAWNTGDTTQSISSVSAGTYSVTITHTGGCVGFDSVQLLSDSLVISEFDVDPLECFGDNDADAEVFTLGGNAPFSYAWSNGWTIPTSYNLIAGTYTVTVTDSSGCVAVDSVIIEQPGSELISSAVLLQGLLCNGDSNAIVAATITGGMAPYDLDWNTGSSQDTLSGLPQGMYILTVADDNDCESTDTVIVPAPDTIYVTVNAMDLLCFDDSSGTVTSTVTGGTQPYAYAWSSGSTTVSIDSLDAGFYGVTVTDANGCTETNGMNVSEPTQLAVTASGTDLLCFMDASGTTSVTALGGTSPYAYQWSSGGVSTSQGNLDAGWQHVTVTDNNGCEQLDSTLLIEPPALQLSMDVTGELLCFNDSSLALGAIPAGGTVPYTFQWSIGLQSSQITNLPAGQYTVTLTDSNNCVLEIDTSFAGPSEVQLNLSATGLLLCAGDSNLSLEALPAGGVPPYSFQWSTGAQSGQITNLPAGQYSVTITDSNNCALSTDTTFVGPTKVQVSFQMTPDSGSCDGQLVVNATGGTAPYGYLWDDPQSQTSDTALNLCKGPYCVTVTDANACEIEACDSVGFVVGTTGSQSISSNITIFPNPNHGNFTLSMIGSDFAAGMNYQILDATGRILQTGIINDSETYLQLSNPPSGIYFLVLTGQNWQKSMKLSVN